MRNGKRPSVTVVGILGAVPSHLQRTNYDIGASGANGVRDAGSPTGGIG